MVKQTIQETLRIIASEMGLKLEPKIEHPTDASHGDYSSNIALVTAKKLGKRPMKLAEELKERLEVKGARLEFIERIEVVLPGFINFWLAKGYLVKNLQTVTHPAERPGLSDRLLGQKIMLEFADPNPFKEFHIGHLRNITLGESFSRLLESQGANVWRVNYQGDVGMHVAKALYGLLREFKMQNAKFKIEEFEKKPLTEKTKILGKAYALGAKAYEEDEKAKKEIQALNVKIYKNDPSVKDVWELGRKWSLDQFEAMYKRVGTTYKRYYFESEAAVPGRQIVLDHIKDGVFERHEDAVVFRGEKQGLHTRVFVTKEDYATYEAKDMALAGIKYRDFPYERSIIITAHEQAPYFSVVLAAMKKVFPELAQKTTHIAFGFVRLKDTKMSSRLGNVITGEWLLDEAKARIKKEFSDMDEETAEKVAVGAVKYSMLKFGTASDIAFSFEESISLEGSSGPYIQYTFARTQSVLSKATSNKKQLTSNKLVVSSEQLEVEEASLLRAIHYFPEVVEEASENFAPNMLCNYLFELSQNFNLFYQKHSILESKQRNFRLALSASVGHVLKNGLYLLGIEAPERM